MRGHRATSKPSLSQDTSELLRQMVLDGMIPLTAMYELKFAARIPSITVEILGSRIVPLPGDPGGVRQGGGVADTGVVSAATTTQPVVVWAPGSGARTSDAGH